MKKIFILAIAAIAMCMTACTGCQNGPAVCNDSIAVDTTAVDSVVLDTVAADTLALDTVDVCE